MQNLVTASSMELRRSILENIMRVQSNAVLHFLLLILNSTVKVFKFMHVRYLIIYILYTEQ